jgi:hypothetical protein
LEEFDENIEKSGRRVIGKLEYLKFNKGELYRNCVGKYGI